jgi:protein SCO1
MKRAVSVLTLMLLLSQFATAFAESMPMLAQKPVEETIREIGIDQKLNEQLPLTLEFKNESGETVRLGDYFGSKPVILNLVYYRCPMLCGFVLDGVVKALKPLKLIPGKDFQMVTVSIDANDTPEKAMEKKEKYVKSLGKPGAQDAWHFLTGDQSSIDALAKSIGFRYVYDSKSNQFAHAGGIVVNTPEGKIARYFYGIEYSSRDLRLGLVEAARGKIGSLADQILLLCFHYDPMTGRYGFFIMNLLRVLSFMMLLGVALGIGLMIRSDRNSKAGAA